MLSLDKLETKARWQGQCIFSTGFLHGYRSRAEVLQAETKRDLLRLIAGHEDQDAARFATPSTAKAARNAKPIEQNGRSRLTAKPPHFLRVSVPPW